MVAQPDADELTTLLFQTFAMLRRQQRRDATGLGPSQHMLLWRLKPPNHPGQPWPHGPSRVSDLARALQLTPAAITQLVADLEGKGYVRRARDERDHRVVLVSLTEAGEGVLAEHRQRSRAEAEKLVALLEPADREALTRILQRLQEAGQAARGGNGHENR